MHLNWRPTQRWKFLLHIENKGKKNPTRQYITKVFPVFALQMQNLSQNFKITVNTAWNFFFFSKIHTIKIQLKFKFRANILLNLKKNPSLQLTESDMENKLRFWLEKVTCSELNLLFSYSWKGFGDGGFILSSLAPLLKNILSPAIRSQTDFSNCDFPSNAISLFLRVTVWFENNSNVL